MRYVPSNPWDYEEDVIVEKRGERSYKTIRVPKKETPRRDRHNEYDEQSDLQDD